MQKLKLALAIASLGFILLAVFKPKDDSDSPVERSGMSIYTDYRTGCQYLHRGGLTPRMDRDGKQLCN